MSNKRSKDPSNLTNKSNLLKSKVNKPTTTAQSENQQPKINNTSNNVVESTNSQVNIVSSSCWESSIQIFNAAHSKNIEAAKNLIQKYESSSEEEDDEQSTGSVLDSVLKCYSGDKAELGKTQQFLENVFQSGTAICLICIATVKRADYIWSCGSCYSFFHLSCIQRWANDSISLKRIQRDADVDYYNNRGELIVKEKKPLQWNCPKCRTDYLHSEIPRNYTCFCSKQLNPTNHPWLIPHSCGEQCQHLLKPDCGHKCVLLCHPGPCPPCPQMVSITCCCGKSSPRTLRCSQKIWKCMNKCTQKLKCGIHTCGLPCHTRSECKPCTKKSVKKCLCENRTLERDCNSLDWRCDKICKKMFSCGLHKCEIKCHAGSCGECPMGKARTCPCGKEKTISPCNEVIGPCGSTCQKILDCGMHNCMERCHLDKCGQCLIITKKKCRCGLYSKDLPCSKTFSCESKCKMMKDCNKHACNRKCCNGDCAPCDKICGKTLSCGKHKCTSLCHIGQCYPCTLKTSVKCPCGNTTISVPCGREKKTKPPQCLKQCRKPSKCHHDNLHKCHSGDCPTCVEDCLEPNTTTNCQHLCSVRCHDAVKFTIGDPNFKPAGPWDKPLLKTEIRKLPHPPCETELPVTCLGGHETICFPCWSSNARTCGRLCNRSLKCGNHKCQLECHVVADLNSKIQDVNCGPCYEECSRDRVNGCSHKCGRPCHASPCAVCHVNIKLNCHCGMTPLYFKCGDFYKFENVSAEENLEHEKMQSCGNRCIRNYDCGHRCNDICHSGTCPNPETCKKKVKVICECKTRKVESSCDIVRSGNFMVKCDEICFAKIEQQREIAANIERKKLEQIEEVNRLELLEYEKKLGKQRKYRERKQYITEQTKNYNPLLIFGISLFVLILSITILYIFEFI